MNMMNMMNWWSNRQGKLEVVGEKLVQSDFVHHKSHMDQPEIEAGFPHS
jgi:hypothetical protein